MRIGYGWIEGQGPASGFFPFIVASLMGLASIAGHRARRALSRRRRPRIRSSDRRRVSDAC